MKAILLVLLLILSAPFLPVHAISHTSQTSQQCQNYFLNTSSGSCPIDFLNLGIVPGDLQVVGVSTNDTSVQVTSVTDSIGDNFTLGIEDTTTFLHTELWYSFSTHTQVSRNFNYSVTLSGTPAYWDMNILAFNDTNVNSVQVTSKGESNINTTLVQFSPVSISNSLVVGFLDLYENNAVPNSPIATNDSTLNSMPNTKYLGPTAAALYANFNYTDSGTLDPPNPIQPFTSASYNGAMTLPEVVNGYSYLLIVFQSLTTALTTSSSATSSSGASPSSVYFAAPILVVIAVIVAFFLSRRRSLAPRKLG